MAPEAIVLVVDGCFPLERSMPNIDWIDAYEQKNVALPTTFLINMGKPPMYIARMPPAFHSEVAAVATVGWRPTCSCVLMTSAGQ